jgi:hypothetical protein
MTLPENKIIEYQSLCKSHLGLDINIEQARIEANHLVRIIRILKRKTI